MKILPGLTFSWKRAVGLTRLTSNIARKTGIPFTRTGREAKVGRLVIRALTGLFK